MRKDLSFGAKVDLIWREAGRLLRAAPVPVAVYLE